MPFFKFRRGDTASVPPAGSAAQALSVEVLRKRAKHRLIGASVLVLLGVLGFPLLFETQPRPIAVDIPIEIPGKNVVRPLVIPAPAAVATAPAPAPAPAKTAAPAATPETITAAASLSPQEEIYPSKPRPALAEPASPAIKKEVNPEPRHEAKAELKPEAKPKPKPEPRPEARAELRTEPKPEAKAEAKPAVKAEARPVPKPAAASDDGARAIALLNGAPASQAPKVAALSKPAATEETKAAAAETKGRMVVQVGAFADAAKAEETRRKLEKAGLATYTQVADTKDGKRIRVRVGPFASKAEAEKAVNKIRSLDLPVAILSF
ncbi:MAG: SPOR domain-containing protein [Burkholderiales bacterium]|nr:SPOR domain-containing protein [Burkholderiales bacterium]